MRAVILCLLRRKLHIKKEEFISRLKDAGNPDEIRRILTESGYTPSEEAVNNIRELINAETETKCRVLSTDELSAVSGGATERDYATEGCAATVENGSHCFGTDGGCLIVNIDFIHPRCSSAARAAVRRRCTEPNRIRAVI